MFAINSSGNFKSESFSAPRKSTSDDDFSIRMSDNKGFKNEKINSNIKPLFSNTSSGNIRIPENKRVNIKPKFISSNSSVKSTDSNTSSNVPIDSFSAFSNPKTSINGSQSSNSDNEEDDDDDDENYASEDDDEDSNEEKEEDDNDDFLDDVNSLI